VYAAIINEVDYRIRTWPVAVVLIPLILLFGSTMLVGSAVARSVSSKRTVESGRSTIRAHNSTSGGYVWTVVSVLTMNPSFWLIDEKRSASAIRATPVFGNVLVRLHCTRL
jgi:Na+-transporting methylmalonyl-CoA/oxaloacetate decarboxylase gamma subunit